MVTACLLFAVVASAEAVPVKLVQADGKWQLTRNGSPYYIKGAGGDHSLDELKAAGGNSTRTWDANEIGPMLDKAHALGMTVTVGFWLGHKEHGFNYNDPAQVKKQYEMVRTQLLKWKDHPAVLMWALGNEMEINHDVPEVWRAVGDLAKLVKSLDTKHPVATVLAEITPSKAQNIKEFAPEVDILGINSYGGLASLPKRLKEAGWTKPYIVTEFGPLGPWESPKTDWNASIEASSSEKARFYAANYETAIQGQPGWCLGSYVFLWGHKQETTPTWFGMMLPSGEALETVDVISRLWTGQWPKNRAPRVESLYFSPSRKRIDPLEKTMVTIRAIDPDGDRLTYRWEIRKEIDQSRYAGEGEKGPVIVASAARVVTEPTLEVTLPRAKGPYRLYVYIYDGKGKAGMINEPFYIR